MYEKYDALNPKNEKKTWNLIVHEYECPQYIQE